MGWKIMGSVWSSQPSRRLVCQSAGSLNARAALLASAPRWCAMAYGIVTTELTRVSVLAVQVSFTLHYCVDQFD